MIEKRPLGNSGLHITPLVLGGNVFGWTIDEKKSFQILDAFVDAGFNMIDTADAYSRWSPGNQGGESETIIGRWLRQSGKRDKVLIATKVGMEMGPGLKGLKKDYIILAVENSLRRLQTDVIDLYQSHKDEVETPVAETLEAYTQLVKQGKVRALGASQLSPERIRESLDTSRAEGLAAYTVLQPLYNLYDREHFENQLSPIVREYNLGVISFYALAAGFLSGKYRSEKDLSKSVRGNMRIKDAYLNPKGLNILDALQTVSEKLHAPMASVAVAWILHNPLITAPIASATSVEQLQSLFKGIQIKLDATSCRMLDDV